MIQKLSKEWDIGSLQQLDKKDTQWLRKKNRYTEIYQNNKEEIRQMYALFIQLDVIYLPHT